MITLAIWRCANRRRALSGATPHDRARRVLIAMLRIRRHGRRNANSWPIAQERKQPGW